MTKNKKKLWTIPLILSTFYPSSSTLSSSFSSSLRECLVQRQQWDMSSRESHQYLDNVQRCSSALSHYKNLQFNVYCLSMIYIVAGVRMPMPQPRPHKIPGICPMLMIYILRAIHSSSCPEWTYSCRRPLNVDRFDQNRNFLSSHASILFHLSSISVFTILETSAVLLWAPSFPRSISR